VKYVAVMPFGSLALLQFLFLNNFNVIEASATLQSRQMQTFMAL